MTSFRRLWIAVAILAFSPAAQATLVFYTNQALWEAAVSGPITVETFDNLTAGSLVAPSVTLGAITFEFPHSTGSNPRIVVDPSGGSLETIVGVDTPSGPFAGNYPEYNNIVLPNPATAFAADFFSATSAGQLIFNIDGEVFELVTYLPSPGDGFFGFISDVSFTTVNITVGNGAFPAELYSIDDVRFDTAADVPEPSSVVLLTGGLALFAFRMRQRRTTPPDA